MEEENQSALKQTALRALETLDRVFADEKQFHRHLINPGKEDMEERIVNKVDTKALKEAASVLKELAGLLWELEGGSPQEQEVRVVYDSGEEGWGV